MSEKINHIKLSNCKSTQAYAKELIDKNNCNLKLPLLVSTLLQTEGVGRRGNEWIKTKNAIALSFVTNPFKVISLSSLEVSLVLKNYIENIYKKSISLKWPNDLIFNEKKIGGVICHLNGEHLIIGIGINLGSFDQNIQGPRAFEAGFLDNKIELNPEDEHQISLDICKFYLKSRYKTSTHLIDQWSESCIHLNKEVEITDGEKKFCGKFIGIGEHGEALIKSQKEIIKVYNGSLMVL